MTRSPIASSRVTGTTKLLEQGPPQELQVNRALSHESLMMLMDMECKVIATPADEVTELAV